VKGSQHVIFSLSHLPAFWLSGFLCASVVSFFIASGNRYRECADSVGIEDAEALIKDMEQALNFI